MHKHGIRDDITSMRQRRGFGRSLEETFNNAEDGRWLVVFKNVGALMRMMIPQRLQRVRRNRDHMLVDDYDPRYLRHMMMLLTEQDQQLINNGATIYVLQDGCLYAVTPFRIAATLPVCKDTQNVQHRFTNGISPLATSRQMPTSIPLPSVPNGMPISMQAYMKGMQPPTTIPHIWICCPPRTISPLVESL